MKCRIGLAALLIGLTALPSLVQANELRIGFMTTLSGRGAAIGGEMKRGWDIGLEHQGWTEDGDELGGVPTTIRVGDDQLQPDVGVQVVNRWLREDQVHIVAGNVWSHVLMAISRPVTRNRAILMSTNAGPSPLAGAQCSKYFISTSWQNDQTPEALGQLLSDHGVEQVHLMAPNYQAGKDMLAGFRRTYQGEITGQILFPVGARDFQAELSQIRSIDPPAVMVFAPASMGIAFFSQWASSGLRDQIDLYSVYTVDWFTLEATGEDAVGSFQTNWWAWDADRPATQRFVRAYIAKHGRPPAHYAAQAYDAPALIAAGVRAVDGNVDDTLELNRAMRNVEYESIRGPYEYNVNGFPIQNFYSREVVMGENGPTIRTTGVVFADHPDAYYEQCPESEHLQ